MKRRKDTRISSTAPFSAYKSIQKPEPKCYQRVTVSDKKAYLKLIGTIRAPNLGKNALGECEKEKKAHYLRKKTCTNKDLSLPYVTSGNRQIRNVEIHRHSVPNPNLSIGDLDETTSCIKLGTMCFKCAG